MPALDQLVKQRPEANLLISPRLGEELGTTAAQRREGVEALCVTSYSPKCLKHWVPAIVDACSQRCAPANCRAQSSPACFDTPRQANT